MDVYWRRLWLMTLWWLQARGIFHEPSVQTIPAPTGTPADSLFGYSVAYQPATKRIIVGAPNSDIIGKVFECKLQSKQCTEFNTTVLEGNEFGKMWLGATVASSHTFTMACAPRYIANKTSNETKIGTFGKCLAASSFSYDFTPLQSLSDAEKGDLYEYERKMDSFGWSVDVTRNGSIIVGGPFMHTGRAITYSAIDSPPKLVPISIYYYKKAFNFGYSVTSGNFKSNNKDDIIYVISSTYESLGYGQLKVYDGKKIEGLLYPTFYKVRVGSMFGAALAAASLLKNGPQALLVGAPAFADDEKTEIDRGAVYIYQCFNNGTTLTPQRAILGTVDGGRFGSAIASLGDLNGDGRDEVAIAAPYEGSGAVYIYSWTTDDSMKLLQKILPPGSGFKTFGLSLAMLQDYDNNGCNELAIGVPEKNMVTVLRCMAKIIVTVLPLVPSITSKYPRARRTDTHFVYKSCVNIEYPTKPENISAEFEVYISIQHPTARLDNSQDNMKYQISLKDKSKTQFCNDVGIIITSDHEPRIQYAIRAKQLNSPRDEEVFDPSRVLMSDISVSEVIDTQWVADCGKSGCKPKFSFTIETTISKNYTIGSTASEYLTIRARNTGDVAYSAYMIVRVISAPVLSYQRTCEQDLGLKALKCQSRTPVKTNADWAETIELDLKSLTSSTGEILVNVTLYPMSTSAEEGLKDKKSIMSPINKILPVTLYPDKMPLVLRGSTNIGNTVEITSEELHKTGKSISHDYTIYNPGITDWANVLCEVTIPKKSFIKEYLVYAEDSSPLQCTTPIETKTGLYSSICTIEELKKKQRFLVMVPIFIMPGTPDLMNLQKRKANVTFSSQVRLIYGERQTLASVTSSLKLKSAKVPLWIIIVAVCVGVFVICIIIFALYECGCLRRKNKRKLRELRKSVYRQSVRRSQISQRRSGDRQSDKLTPENGENRQGELNPINVDEEKTPAEVHADKLKKNDEQGEDTKANNQTEHTEVKYSKTKKGHDEVTLLKTLPEEDEECKIKKKQQIIRGLQKNLEIHRSNQFLGPPPKEKYNEHDF